MDNYERTCREYGWIPTGEVAEAVRCPLATFIAVALPDVLAELERQLAEGAGATRFVSSYLDDVSHATTWRDLAEERGYGAYEEELSIPGGLPDTIRGFLLDLRAWLESRKDIGTGGCRAFYSPEEFRRRGFQTSDAVVCVIGHDGGSLAKYFNLSYCDYEAFESMRKFMEVRGYWCECQTAAETYVYRL